jgi:predicted nucleic acid-binding protein
VRPRVRFTDTMAVTVGRRRDIDAVLSFDGVVD